jgi:uncharacterized protein YkwD
MRNPDVVKAQTLLAKLDERGEEVGVSWIDAALKAHYRGNRRAFEHMIEQGELKGIATAKEVFITWNDLIKARVQTVQDVRGATPKSTSPPKEDKVIANSASEVLGLTEEQRDLILRTHNEWRKKYFASDLQYDERLAQKAQAWAIHLLQIKKLEHDTQNRGCEGFEGMTGENLSFRGGTQKGLFVPDHAWPVEQWGGEVRHFNLDTKKDKGTGVTGHFTQLVWKSTTKVGCGFAMSNVPKGNDYFEWKAYWVCNYHPAGNVLGQYGQNIL